MKAKINHEVKQFNPIELEITIESQEELNLIYFLFNRSELCELMVKYANIEPSKIRSVLSSWRGVNQSEVSDMFDKLMK